MVVRSCAVGVPDAIKGHIIKVFVVLREGVTMSADEVIESLRALCRDNIAKYARPREFEFLKELPYTKVGKIAYTELEKLASDMMEAVDNVMEPPRAAR
jgi:acyl-coenzyme A synthetase/AMP-(fatty) acid ligase